MKIAMPVLAIIFIFLTNSVFAAKYEPIVGAFGLKLGDVFDVSQAIIKVDGKESTTCSVKPPQPDANYDNYTISVSKADGRITRISANYKVSSSADKKKLIKEINDGLLQRYGRVKSAGSASSDTYYVMAEEAYVAYTCYIYTGYTGVIIFSWGSTKNNTNKKIDYYILDESKSADLMIHSIKMAVMQQQKDQKIAQEKQDKERLKQEYIKSHSALSENMKQAILDNKIMIGMESKIVEIMWGSPEKINRHVGSYGVTEQWVYGKAPNAIYVYFDNGILKSWQE